MVSAADEPTTGLPHTGVAPVLPSRDQERTIRFWEAVGFALTARNPDPNGYLVMAHGAVALHFFTYPDVVADDSYAGAYVWCDDVDAHVAGLNVRHLPLNGVPRYGPAQDRPWGMREAYIVDPDGSLVRFGSRMKPGRRDDE